MHTRTDPVTTAFLFLFLLLPVGLAHAAFELDFERSLTVRCTYADHGTRPHEQVTVEGTKVDAPDVAGVTIFQKGMTPTTVTHVVKDGQVAECVFPSGNRMRVKVGSGIARAHGLCGGDPEVFTSIWVNQRKVVSRRRFEGRCWDSHQNPAVTFEFSNDPSASLWKCEADPLPEPDSKAGVAPPAQTEPLSECIAYPDLERFPIDLIEYPLPGQKVLAVGDFEVLSNTGPVCDVMLEKLRLDVRQNKEPKFERPASTLTDPDWTEPSVELPKELEGSREGIFDFDNDGTLDRVFLQLTWGGYMDGSTLLVMPGTSRTQLKVAGTPLEPTSWFIPCQLDPVPHRIADCPTFSQNADEAGLPMSSAGRDPVRFRARYTSLTPFFFQGLTYLDVGSSSDDTREYFAVLKPLPHKRFQEMCLFRQVAENF